MMYLVKIFQKVILQDLVKKCSIEGCERKHSAKGLCKYHYEHTPERKAKVKELLVEHENYFAGAL